jgi:hypothetical protein
MIDHMIDSTFIVFRSTTWHSLTALLKRWRARIDDDKNQLGKSNLKRIVSKLTRLIQRTTGVSENRIEYEYRDAEYEPNQDVKTTQNVRTDIEIACSSLTR